MTLTAQITHICNRLAPFGWRDLLKRHGFNLDSPNLIAEFYKDISLTIDRNIPGFEDFVSSGKRGIEPYIPCKSLLFHALSSPNVHPGNGNEPVKDQNAYPTLEELDTLENFIFSTEHTSSGIATRDEMFYKTSFNKDNLVIATFAYQYRVGSRSVNRSYADIAYSRTGIARVGTTAYNYVPSKRSFWTISEGDNKIPVLPVRYGVFLAEIRMSRKEHEVLSTNIDSNVYIFPIHKLFKGNNCIGNITIPSFTFKENHLSEKLKRLFNLLSPNNPAFNTLAAPFILTSKNGDNMAAIQVKGSSALLVPDHSNELIHVAKQEQKVVNFRVPADDGNNRFLTSFQNLVIKNKRIGPEYLNIRFEFKNNTINNISDQFNSSQEIQFLNKIRTGGYDAVAFLDKTCDGCIMPHFNSKVSLSDKIIPAYSLITAPDFFPLCDQAEISEWITNNQITDQFEQGGPEPLSNERMLLVNPFIEHPFKNGPAFIKEGNNNTTTALVSMTVFPNSNTPQIINNQQISFLPDAASDVFAPGWDVSRVFDKNSNQSFISSFGLGSPFPEDSKLCAALNSFWPAVAPDASRTFINGPTAFPMLDSELGFHAKHPKVIAHKENQSLGWDGEQGPFFEGTFDFVNYTSIERSDYTANALKGNISIGELSKIDAREWIKRMIAMRNCVFILPPSGDKVGDRFGNTTTELKLVSVEKIENWQQREDNEDNSLTGIGYFFQFATLKGGELLTSEAKRRRKAISLSYTCKISDTFIFWKENADIKFNKVRRTAIPLKW